MSKKRGLSLEEKREKMLQIFYESQDFFLLKELEKLGPRKGVITQSVKDVVQSLVDDDLVSKDKIGTSGHEMLVPPTTLDEGKLSMTFKKITLADYFDMIDLLLLPVRYTFGVFLAVQEIRNVNHKLESELKNSKKRYIELVDQCEALKKGREESDEREEALADLKAIELKHNELKEELGKYADNDPAAFEAMKEAIEVAHAAANRWTDNIFTLRQWCSNNFPQAKEQLENMYKEIGITDDFDYLELASLPLRAVGDLEL